MEEYDLKKVTLHRNTERSREKVRISEEYCFIQKRKIVCLDISLYILSSKSRKKKWCDETLHGFLASVSKWRLIMTRSREDLYFAPNALFTWKFHQTTGIHHSQTKEITKHLTPEELYPTSRQNMFVVLKSGSHHNVVLKFLNPLHQNKEWGIGLEKMECHVVHTHTHTHTHTL